MHNHFEHYLNTKSLIEKYNPQFIVEAGCGRSTTQLRALQKARGFRLVCIDVAYNANNERARCPIPPGQLIKVTSPEDGEELELIYGIAHLAFQLFEAGSIDMAIVDTDHNGWTLKKELEALESKMKKGGLILLHDVETFKHTNGTMERYETGQMAYPLKEILAGPTMGEVVDAYRAKWKVVAETQESEGAIAFQV